MLPLPDPTKPLEQQELTILFSCLLFGEARGAHDDCKVGVASVVRNRVLSGRFGGDRWDRVILRPFQFSCFLETDPNRKKLLEPLKYEKEAVWNSCYQIASAVLNGLLMDPTQRATHYHSYHEPFTPLAFWTAKFVHTCDIAPFHFFRDPAAFKLEPESGSIEEGYLTGV